MLYNTVAYGVFSFLGQHICKFIYLLQSQKVFTKEKSSIPTGLVRDTNMAALLFFWDTNMADMTLCEKAPLLLSKAYCVPANS